MKMLKQILFKVTLFLTVLILALSVSCKEEAKTPNSKQIEVKVKKDKEITSKLKVVSWRSHLAWRANKIMESHSGKITIKSGDINMYNKEIVSGEFEIDMNSLTVTDLKGKDKEELESLLKGTKKGKEGTFFNISEFPLAKFEVFDSYVTNETTYLSGDLTINGITNPIEAFAINFEEFPGDDSKTWLTSKNFPIDRTKWDINFGSKTVFEDIVDEQVIRDEVMIRIKVLLENKK